MPLAQCVQGAPRRQCAVAATARKQQPKQQPKQKQQQGGKGFGGSVAPAQPAVPEPTAATEGQANAAPGSQQPAGAAPTDSGVLPSVSRGRIFAVCAQVSVLVTTLGFGLRQVAPAISPAVGGGQADTVEALLDCECLLLLLLLSG